MLIITNQQKTPFAPFAPSRFTQFNPGGLFRGLPSSIPEGYLTEVQWLTQRSLEPKWVKAPCEAISYFQFRPEIQNANQKILLILLILSK